MTDELHPLLNPVILDNLLTVWDPPKEELMSLRLVCKEWNRATFFLWRNKRFLNIDNQEVEKPNGIHITMEKLVQYLESNDDASLEKDSNSIDVDDMWFHKLKSKPYKYVKLRNCNISLNHVFWKYFGPKLEMLYLLYPTITEAEEGKEDVDLTKIIFEKCPKLKKLRLVWNDYDAQFDPTPAELSQMATEEITRIQSQFGNHHHLKSVKMTGACPTAFLISLLNAKKLDEVYMDLGYNTGLMEISHPVAEGQTSVTGQKTIEVILDTPWDCYLEEPLEVYSTPHGVQSYIFRVDIDNFI